MRSAIMWILGLAVVGGGAAYAFVSHTQQAKQATYDAELAKIKRAFLAQSSSLVFLDEASYQKEIGPHLSKYFRELSKLQRQYPEFYDVERERKAGEERLAMGQMTESQKIQRDERIDITLDLFNRMMSGQFRPIYTRVDKNFRFDIYDISPARVGGEQKVKFSFVHWAPFPPEHKPNQGPVTYRSITGNIKAEQEAGKPAEVHKFEGESQPPSLQINPERWVAEFPPGMEIGYYDLPQFPREAQFVELAFEFDIRTVGGSDLPVSIAFPEVPVAEAWKVAEGQKWEAQERFATDDELQAHGVQPTQE